MPYSPKAVANYFLDLAEKSGKPLDPMKMQKLVYFAHGWYLLNYNEPLLNEKIQAWKFGPVIQSLYHEFKAFGNNPIDRKAKEESWIGLVRKETVPIIPVDDTKTRQFLDSFWEVYSKFSGVALSNLTHRPGTPWEKTYAADVRENEIDDNLILEYFKTLVPTESAAA